jgi:hypothetical protein
VSGSFSFGKLSRLKFLLHFVICVHLQITAVIQTVAIRMNQGVRLKMRLPMVCLILDVGKAVVTLPQAQRKVASESFGTHHKR